MSLPEIVFIAYCINIGILLAVVIYMLYTPKRPRWMKITAFTNITLYTIFVVYSLFRITFTM